MSQQFVTDGFAFARDGRVLEGTLAVVNLTRLHDLLAEVEGEIRFRMRGMTGQRGEPLIRLEAEGDIFLACQRCLGAIRHSLEVDSLLELVPEGAEMSQDELEDDSRDYLPVAGSLEVAALVEEEILLSLPVAPRHEKCGLPSDSEAGERVNPFAKLVGLKGKLN